LDAHYYENLYLNHKSEYRNHKQFLNPNFQILNAESKLLYMFNSFEIDKLDIVSIFGFDASNFLLKKSSLKVPFVLDLHPYDLAIP
jgi:hypothetical protein